MRSRPWLAARTLWRDLAGLKERKTPDQSAKMSPLVLGASSGTLSARVPRSARPRYVVPCADTRCVSQLLTTPVPSSSRRQMRVRAAAEPATAEVRAPSFRSQLIQRPWCGAYCRTVGYRVGTSPTGAAIRRSADRPCRHAKLVHAALSCAPCAAEPTCGERLRWLRVPEGVHGVRRKWETNRGDSSDRDPLVVAHQGELSP